MPSRFGCWSTASTSRPSEARSSSTPRVCSSIMGRRKGNAEGTGGLKVGPTFSGVPVRTLRRLALLLLLAAPLAAQEPAGLLRLRGITFDHWDGAGGAAFLKPTL